MLHEIGKNPLHPPLIILRGLSAIDVDWIKKYQELFPRVCFAVRAPSRKKFDASLPDLQKYNPANIFWLPEIAGDPDDDDPIWQATSRAYDEQVRIIAEFYQNSIPSRKELNVDAKMFEGKISRTKIATETKEERPVVEEVQEKTVQRQRNRPKTVRLENGGHWEERKKKRSTGSRWGWGVVSLGLSELDPYEYEHVWVKDYREEVHNEIVSVDEKVQVRVTQKYRNAYSRDQFEVWKELQGGLRIFVKDEFSEWRQTDSELLSSTTSDPL
jgi:hypothetical protein